MTTVTASCQNNHYSLECVDHAGDPVVCSAISALCYALEGCIFNNENAYAHYSTLEPGHAKIEYISEDERADEDFRCVLIGLMQIECSHPNEIQIEQNIFD